VDNGTSPNAVQVRVLTHKVIHTGGEYLFGTFKKNDLGSFPATRLENVEHCG
jgi:hypothetical protein